MCNETKNRDRSRRDTMAKYDFYTFDKMIFYTKRESSLEHGRGDFRITLIWVRR